MKLAKHVKIFSLVVLMVSLLALAFVSANSSETSEDIMKNNSVIVIGLFRQLKILALNQ